MSSFRAARPNERKIVPAFIVRELEGKVKRVLHGWDAKGNKTEKEVEVPAGFEVRFPAKGHSIRVRNASELRRLGFDQTIPLVDANAEEDDVEGYMPNTVAASVAA